jgi:hypothetical protein
VRGSWVLIHLRCRGRQIACRQWSVPTQGTARLVSYCGHHPTDLQQTHSGRHVDDKDDQARQHKQNPERDSEAERICAGRRTLHNNDDDRVRKRGEKQPKGKLRDARSDAMRITRGESWALASWRATSVMVKTTPTKVSIDAAMMPRSASAEPALTGRPPPTLSSPGIESALETATPTAITGLATQLERPRTVHETTLARAQPESIPGFRP